MARGRTQAGSRRLRNLPWGVPLSGVAGGEWSLVIAYPSWPNGLKIAADRRILVADSKHGLKELDAKAGRMQPLLTARNSKSFRGCNDLHPAASGDIDFTDRERTGSAGSRRGPRLRLRAESGTDRAHQITCGSGLLECRDRWQVQQPSLYHGVGDRHGAGRRQQCSRPGRNVRRM
jgi:hypothetical protein